MAKETYEYICDILDTIEETRENFKKETMSYDCEKINSLIENLQLNNEQIKQCLMNEEFLFMQMKISYGLSVKSVGFRTHVKTYFEELIKKNNVDLYIEAKLEQREKEVKRQLKERYEEMVDDIIEIFREYNFNVEYLE